MERDGLSEPFDAVLIRKQIKLRDVPLATFVGPPGTTVYYCYVCVLIKLRDVPLATFVGPPGTTVYYCYMCPHTTAMYVSSYYCYICVLIKLRDVPLATFVGSPGTTVYYCYICVLILLLCMCPHQTPRRAHSYLRWPAWYYSLLLLYMCLYMCPHHSYCHLLTVVCVCEHRYNQYE